MKKKVQEMIYFEYILSDLLQANYCVYRLNFENLICRQKVKIL